MDRVLLCERRVEEKVGVNKRELELERRLETTKRMLIDAENELRATKQAMRERGACHCAQKLAVYFFERRAAGF